MSEDLNERVHNLEVQVQFLLDVVNTLRKTVDDKIKLTYGTKKSWTKEQHQFLISSFNKTKDLNTLTEIHNEEWGPRGYVERSPTAIACQLYKIIEDHSILPDKVIKIAEKYM